MGDEVRKILIHVHVLRMNGKRKGQGGEEGEHHAEEIFAVARIRYVQFRRGSIHLQNPAS